MAEFNFLSEETTWCQNRGLNALVRRATSRDGYADPSTKDKTQEHREKPSLPGYPDSQDHAGSQILEPTPRDRQYAATVTRVLDVTCSRFFLCHFSRSSSGCRWRERLPILGKMEYSLMITQWMTLNEIIPSQ